MKVAQDQVKSVIFDLDGTLIHTLTDFKKMGKMLIELFRSNGVDENVFSSVSTYVEMIDKGLEELKKRGYSSNELKIFKSRVHLLLNQIELENVDKAYIIKGADETLKKLKNYGLKIGVVTRGCREYAIKALEIAGLTVYVDKIVARDDVENAKPEPEQIVSILKTLNADLKDSIYVGDHPIDVICAKKSKIQFIGVLTGYSDFDSLRSAGCEKIIPNVSKLPELIL